MRTSAVKKIINPRSHRATAKRIKKEDTKKVTIFWAIVQIY